MRRERAGQHRSRFGPIEQFLEREREINVLDQERLYLLNRLSDLRASLACYLNDASAEEGENQAFITECRLKMQEIQREVEKVVSRLKGLGATWV